MLFRLSRNAKKENLDAVVIASPNYTHFDILQHIFENYPQLAVLAEKPICTNRDDCERLLEISKNHKAPFWVAMEYRFIPAVSKLSSDVHNNLIGNLKMCLLESIDSLFYLK